MSDRHRVDHEVFHVTRDMARWSEHHVAELARRRSGVRPGAGSRGDTRRRPAGDAAAEGVGADRPAVGARPAPARRPAAPLPGGVRHLAGLGAAGPGSPGRAQEGPARPGRALPPADPAGVALGQRQAQGDLAPGAGQLMRVTSPTTPGWSSAPRPRRGLGFRALVLATTSFSAVQLGWVAPTQGRVAAISRGVPATVPLQFARRRLRIVAITAVAGDRDPSGRGTVAILGFLVRDRSPITGMGLLWPGHAGVVAVGLGDARPGAVPAADDGQPELGVLPPGAASSRTRPALVRALAGAVDREIAHALDQLADSAGCRVAVTRRLPARGQCGVEGGGPGRPASSSPWWPSAPCSPCSSRAAGSAPCGPSGGGAPGVCREARYCWRAPAVRAPR